MALDPQRAGTVYIVDETDRLLRSTDSGETWQIIYTATQNLRALVHDPLVSGHLYLGAAGPTVLASSDGGHTWSELAGWGGTAVAQELGSLSADSDPVTRTLYAGLNGVWTRSFPAPKHKVFIPVVLRSAQ